MGKLQTLFDLGEIEKRKTPKEKKFQEENLDLLKEFSAAVDYAFEMLHKHLFSIIKPKAMDRNLPAVSVISFIRQHLINKLPANCREATVSRFKLVTDNGQSIFVKKLDDQKMPSNIQTEANDMIINQFTIPGSDTGANIFLGYNTDEGFSKVNGKYAVCLDGENKLWAFDISTVIAKKEATIIKFTTKSNKPKLKEGVVKIKKEKRKNE